MRRNSAIGLALFTMLTSVVACSEQATSPMTRNAPQGAPNLDIIVNRIAEDSTNADFTVTPTGGTFVLGPHAIHFPANSICDPLLSSYGVGEWDNDCVPATTDIQIHAEIRSDSGVSTIDFSPALRFVPSANSDNYVWLLMKTDAAKTLDPRLFNIWWKQHAGSELVNEAAADTSLRTYVWQSGGVVFRRVKHFSVFVVHDGCEEGQICPEAVSYTDVSPVEF